MEASSPQQLETLKYSDLQRLAKSAGLKANLKADKLLNVLKQHFCEPVKENGNTSIKRACYTDAEECDSSQIPVNLSTVTKRRRKQKDKAPKNPKGKNVDEEKTEVHPEKEILTELKENKETQDSGNTLNVIQNECLMNSRMAENLAENSATPSLQQEKDSAMQKRSESKTLTDSFSGKIPCYTGSMSKPARTKKTTTTPDFKKLHEAQFKKMLSIDDYIERKNKMIRNFSNSVNEVKMLAKKSNYLKSSSQNEMLNTHSNVRTRSRGILLSPLPQKNMPSTTCTPVNLRRSPRNSLGTANKSILSRKSAYNSTGLSATKMNVRFSESTKDNEHKRSLTKTPSRKSPFLNYCTPDSQKSNKFVTRKDVKGSTTKCQLTEIPINSAVTPFKFATQTAERTSTKKPIFDLQASLSKPLSYQPHRGKLKPWGKSKENDQNTSSHKRDYKQPLLQTREERREKHAQGRKLRKDQVLGTRRGLSVF